MGENSIVDDVVGILAVAAGDVEKCLCGPHGCLDQTFPRRVFPQQLDNGLDVRGESLYRSLIIDIFHNVILLC